MIGAENVRHTLNIDGHLTLSSWADSSSVIKTAPAILVDALHISSWMSAGLENSFNNRLMC
jgi:hypothetical protein